MINATGWIVDKTLRRWSRTEIIRIAEVAYAGAIVSAVRKASVRVAILSQTIFRLLLERNLYSCAANVRLPQNPTLWDAFLSKNTGINCCNRKGPNAGQRTYQEVCKEERASEREVPPSPRLDALNNVNKRLNGRFARVVGMCPSGRCCRRAAEAREASEKRGRRKNEGWKNNH